MQLSMPELTHTLEYIFELSSRDFRKEFESFKEKLNSIHDQYERSKEHRYFINRMFELKQSRVAQLFGIDLLLSNMHGYCDGVTELESTIVAYRIRISGIFDDILSEAKALYDDSSEIEIKNPVNRPIENLNLTVRSLNLLHGQQVFTIGQLLNKTEIDILKMPNSAKRILTEIKEALSQYGFPPLKVKG